MKKSSVLSLLTAGAVLVTTATTYAVWDKLNDTSSGTIAVKGESTTVTAADMTFVGNSPALGASSIDYTGSATFTIANPKNAASSLELKPSVKKEGVDVDTSMYDIVIKESETAITPAEGTYTDTTISEGANTYTVVVTVKDASLNNTTLDVTLEGTLK